MAKNTRSRAQDEITRNAPSIWYIVAMGNTGQFTLNVKVVRSLIANLWSTFRLQACLASQHNRSLLERIWLSKGFSLRPLFAVAPFLFVTPAYAQQAQQPSQQSIITVLHQELQETQDSLTLAQARIVDLQEQVTTLRAQLSQPKPKPKDH